ncbi:MAG TPA: RNA polymerase sigma factor [Ktedonobacterales bacterium]|nr:RNA polymerase sigma factor [Ktedonobacterales bacterium]
MPEKACERRPRWIALLAVRAFSQRVRRRDAGMEASATSNQQATVPAKNQLCGGPIIGDDAAFDAFFTQHEGTLYGYLRRMLLTHEAALDIAQEAFFRAWQRFEMLRGYERPQAWLFRVATNLALDTLRRRQPARLLRIFSEHGTGTSDDSDSDDAIPGLVDPSDMEQALAARELVNQALRHIPDRQRAAVLLWAAHGLTCTEIGAALDTTESNARQLLSRGRTRFREAYEQEQRND